MRTRAFDDNMGRVVLFAVAAGFGLGFFRLRLFAYTEIELMAAGLRRYAQHFGVDGLGMGVFGSVMLYGRYIAAFWLCRFMPLGWLMAAGVAAVRGMSLGFTTALLSATFGFRGYIMAVGLYGIQNALLFYGFVTITKEQGAMLRPLLLSMLVLFMAAAAEGFLVPLIAVLFMP